MSAGMPGGEAAGSEYPLRRIYFYLVSGCNLRCRHCWVQPEFQGGGDAGVALDFGQFRRVLDQAVGLGLVGVKLTGGEPLLHPGIFDILREVRRRGLQLSVETNGLPCCPEVSREIAACRGASVSVSLDGADSRTNDWMRGVEGAFEAALAGIGNLVQAGLKPQIIMTVMRRNRDQVEDMLRLAGSLGAGSVKFNMVQPTARGEKMHRSGQTLPVGELVELGGRLERLAAREDGVKIIPYHPPAFRPLGRMFGVPSRSGCWRCSIHTILGVLADGSYALCGIGETVPELVFGSVDEDRLDEVWRESPVLGELRRGLPGRLEGVCSRCLMAGSCLGYCVAQNYYRARSLWAPFWFCEEAQRLGLFPATRLKPERAAVVAGSQCFTE